MDNVSLREVVEVLDDFGAFVRRGARYLCVLTERRQLVGFHQQVFVHYAIDVVHRILAVLHWLVTLTGAGSV